MERDLPLREAALELGVEAEKFDAIMLPWTAVGGADDSG
jgi:hypothetical protein